MILRMENITLRRGGKLLLKNITGELAPGYLHFLAGVNGSGKSSLLKTLCGYYRPDSGEVRLDEKPLSQISGTQRARRLGVISQNSMIALDFTAREMVMLSASARFPRLGNWSREQLQCIDRALEQFNLTHLANQPVKTLSGGEFQRVQIAGMAALQPEIMLLDEPVSAMDPVGRNQIMVFLEEYARTHTVLMITHDFELLGRAGGDLWCLDKEHNFYSGKASELLNEKFLSMLYNSPATVEVSANGRRRIYFD